MKNGEIFRYYWQQFYHNSIYKPTLKFILCRAIESPEVYNYFKFQQNFKLEINSKIYERKKKLIV